MCDASIHDVLIDIDEQICPFCDILLDVGKKIPYKCCENSQIVEVDGIRVCINPSCGLVHECIEKCNFIDFYENMHRIKRKSVYIRKYHIEKIVNDLLFGNNVELTHNQRTKVYKIFELIGLVTNQINENRKRIISVKYLLKRIFDMMDIKYDISVTKSIRTLTFYNAYWEKIITVIGDKIKSIIDK